MLHRQANKYSGTKKVDSVRHVMTYRSHNRRDYHGNGRKSRSMRRHHHSIDKSTRISHANSGPGRNPSVSPVRRQRRRPEADILQGELKKIKPPNFIGEYMKGEEVDVWLLEMDKHFQLHV
jgi:hypothetical protein